MHVEFSRVNLALILMLGLQSLVAASDSEVIEDVLGSLDWMDDLSHYDVEVKIRQSGESSIHFFEKIAIYDEIWDGESKEFAIGAASGQQQLITEPPSQRDLSQQWISYGNKQGAKREVLNSNFAISNIICRPSKYGCRDAARGMALNASIMHFVLPSSDGPAAELQSLLNLLSTLELHEETVEVKQNDEKRKLKKVRMTARLRDANEPNKHYMLAYLITISKDGHDANRVLSIQKGMLKPGAKQYRSSNDIYPFERSVSIKWEEFDNSAGKKVTLPVSVMKRFSDDPHDRKRDTMIEKITFDWRRVNSKKHIADVKLNVANRVLSIRKKIE